MARLGSIWRDLQEKETDAEVFNYWQKRRDRILKELPGGDPEIGALLIKDLARAMNEKGAYASVYDLYSSAYLADLKRLEQKPERLDALEYELARGLFHNKKFREAHRLFERLEKRGYEAEPFAEWKKQAALAGFRERFWFRTDLFPAFGRFLIFGAYVSVVQFGDAFLWSTCSFLLFYPLYEAWWVRWKLRTYSRDRELLQTPEQVPRKVRNWLLFQVFASLLVLPLSLSFPDQTDLLAIALVVFQQLIHSAFNLFYLPDLIGAFDSQGCNGG